MADRRDQYKKGVDLDASRRDRMEQTVAIRKAKKAGQSTMRRKIVSEASQEEAEFAQKSTTASLKLKDRLAMLPTFVQQIWSNDRAAIHQATEGIRRLLSLEQKPPIAQVIATGIVPRLVQFIAQEESHELQFEAAWALTNIASGTTDQTAVVIEAGAVPLFTKLLGSENADVREQSIWALGNISGDAVQYRDMVLNTGAMPLLLQVLRSPSNKLSVYRNGVWLLSNLVRGKPSPEDDVVLPAIPVLADLLNNTNDGEVLADAAWALSYISDSVETRVEAVINSGICARLVQLLLSPIEVIQTPALRAVGNIVTGSDAQTQVMINLGVLSYLGRLLGAYKAIIVREACWTISNITAGIPLQIQAVIDADIIPSLIRLRSHIDLQVRKEAAWALSNAISGGTVDQIKTIIRAGVIPPFCSMLNEQDHPSVLLALDCLENILKLGQQEEMEQRLDSNPYVHMMHECGAIDSLENLQSHPELDVENRAAFIVQRYFDGVEEEAYGAPDAGQIPMAPAGGQYQFNSRNFA